MKDCSVLTFLVLFLLYRLREKYRKPKVVEATAEVSPSTAEGLELGRVSPHKSKGPHKSEKLVVDEHSLLIHDAHSSSAGYHSVPHVDILQKPSLASSSRGNSYGGTTSRSEADATSTNTASRGTTSAEDTQSEDDDGEERVQTITEQIHEIWETVQLQAVWRPMTFVYIFNMFQVPNVAWQSYLQLCLHFPAWILGGTVMLGSFMTFAGVLGYKYFFFKSSWRSIYVWTVMLTAFFSLMQLVLIFQWNVKYLHLSNYLFSIGDDVISSYISGIQFLPLCIMYMRLCPDGAEGSSYAMLTTFGNIALVCASNIGNQLANVWDVSNEAMRAQDVSGLWKLNTLTSVLAVLPLALLFLLPKDAEEQDELAKSKAKSPFAGAVFLCVLFGSLTWTTVTALWRINE